MPIPVSRGGAHLASPLTQQLEGGEVVPLPALFCYRLPAGVATPTLYQVEASFARLCRDRCDSFEGVRNCRIVGQRSLLARGVSDSGSFHALISRSSRSLTLSGGPCKRNAPCPGTQCRVPHRRSHAQRTGARLAH